MSFYKDSNQFYYNSNYTCEMSMVLTGAAFLHKVELFFTFYLFFLFLTQFDWHD